MKRGKRRGKEETHTKYSIMSGRGGNMYEQEGQMEKKEKGKMRKEDE